LSMGKSMLVLLAGANTESIGDLLERIFTMLCKYTIVEIVLKHTVHVLNAWKSLEGWIDSIFNLKQVIILAFKAQIMQLRIIQSVN
uniref:Secreted protein n=1 Tax=Gongylonema pulchrum TaxID=637853 RepID=A0A183DA27_9BILA